MQATSQARLDQARRRWSEIDGEIRVFISGDQPVTSFATDECGWTTVAVAADMDPPPLTLGVLFGELMHNLRSTLDNLVFDLAGQPKGNKRGQTSFPIADSEDDYLVARREGEASMRERCLEGVPDPMKDAIDALQPFNPLDDFLLASWGTERDRHPLQLLRVLSNADKHRIIHPAAALAEPPSMLPSGGMPPGEIEVELPDVGKPIAKGLVVARYRHSDPAGRGQPVLIRPSVRIRFGAPGTDMGDALCLISVIDRIVSRFEFVAD